MSDNESILEQRIDRLSNSARELLERRLAGMASQRQAEIGGKQRLLAYVIGDGIDGDSLRSFLQSSLPDYMVPQTVTVVDSLPKTPAGKIDRQALRTIELDESDSDNLELVAPRNSTEEILASIWASVLGLDELSVHDNFFEVGGDSLLSIRILARARQQGLQIRPERFFSHPTIAEQAEIAGAPKTVQVESGQVRGAVPLTPIQHWFFDRIPVDPQQWNQSMLFSVPEALDSVTLERALQTVLLHHDALRMRFLSEGGQWRQDIVDLGAKLPFSVHDLSEIAPDQRDQAIDDVAARLNESLEFSQGLLLRMALMKTAPGRRNLLLVLAHHLIIDAESWRLLTDDLETVCKQILDGERIELPAKTSSFKAWSKRLVEYAQSSPVQEQLAYWNRDWSADAAELPTDFDAPAEANCIDSVAHVKTSLDLGETRALLYDVPKAYNTQINDALLTALGLACNEWIGRNVLLVDLEGHGREALFEDLDISRTVGWFTTVFPVLLQPDDRSHPGAALAAIKDQLRSIPVRGIGHGMLRYLSGDENTRQVLGAKTSARICFNYLGQMEDKESLFRGEQENLGPVRSKRGIRAYLLDVNARVAGGQLHVEWSYSGRFHRRDTIEQLASRFMQVLRELVQHCKLPEAGGHTPSDFPLADLDQDELDSLSELLGRADESDGTG